MFDAGAIVGRIGIDTKQWDRSANKVVKDCQRMGAAVQKAGQGMVNFGRSLSIAGAAISAISVLLVKSAADAEESENLFSVSMGKMGKAAREWSEEFSEAVGLNEFELRKQVGTLNLMMKGMGATEESAFSMAKGLTQLAYDMASLRNIPLGEAFEKITSGIVGMPRPLQDLGIVINETAIQTWALTNGLIKQGEQMTNQQKVYARYRLLLKLTKEDQGDLVRTIEALTNQWRVMMEQVKKVAISLGEPLLAPVTKAVKMINNLLTNFRDLGEETKVMIGHIVVWGTILAGTLVTAGPLIWGLGKSLTLLGGIIKLVGNRFLLAWGKALIPIAVLGAAIYTFRTMYKTNFHDIRTITDDFIGMVKFAASEVGKWFVNLVNKIGLDWENLIWFLKKTTRDAGNVIMGTFAFVTEVVSRTLRSITEDFPKRFDAMKRSMKYLAEALFLSPEEREKQRAALQADWEKLGKTSALNMEKIIRESLTAYKVDYMPGIEKIAHDTVETLKLIAATMPEFTDLVLQDIVKLFEAMKEQAGADIDALFKIIEDHLPGLVDLQNKIKAMIAEVPLGEMPEYLEDVIWAFTDIIKKAEKDTKDGTKEMANAWEEYVARLKADFSDVKNYWMDAWGGMASSIENAMSYMFQNIITGAASWKDSVKLFFEDLGRSFARMVSEMIARWMMFQAITGFAKITGMSLGGEGGLGAALQAVTGLGGGGTAQPTMSAQAGLAHVPHTGPYQLHQGEEVVPADKARGREAEPVIELTNINVITPEAVAAAMGGRAGKRTVLNIIGADALRKGRTTQLLRGGG